MGTIRPRTESVTGTELQETQNGMQEQDYGAMAVGAEPGTSEFIGGASALTFTS